MPYLIIGLMKKRPYLVGTSEVETDQKDLDCHYFSGRDMVLVYPQVLGAAPIP